MIDLAQADRTLYSSDRPHRMGMSWTQALQQAAEEMGYPHWFDVPKDLVQCLHMTARAHRSQQEL